VDGGGRTVNFGAVEEYPAAVARDAGIEAPFFVSRGQFEGVSFDAHFAAAHRVAADEAGFGSDFAAAGQAKILAEMRFFRRAWRKKFHSFGDFHEAFLALALFAAGGGDFDSH